MTRKPKDRLKGGLADTADYRQFDPAQLKKGIKVEMEHTTNRAIAREIAADHLMEHPRYYDHLEQMERTMAATKSKTAPKLTYTRCPTKRVVPKGALTAARRRQIPKKMFALPAKKALPIHDKGHTQAALGRLNMMWNDGSITPAQYRQAYVNIAKAASCFGITLRQPPLIPIKDYPKSTKNPGNTRSTARKAVKKAPSRKSRRAPPTSKANPLVLTPEPTTSAQQLALPTTTNPNPSATRKPATRKPATRKPATRKPATRKPATRKPATRKPATRKPATRKPATRKPATRKPATRKPATRKPATRKPATQPNPVTTLNIKNRSALSILGQLEGKRWFDQQQKNKISPQGFQANFDVFEAIQQSGLSGRVHPTDVLPGTGKIAGARGTTYHVDSNGRITLVAATASKAKITKASKLGIAIE